MFRLLVTAALALLALRPGPPGFAGEPEPGPSTPPLGGWLSEINAEGLGVDAAGRLWAWSENPSRVRLYDPDGVDTRQVPVPRGGAVDADSRWGVLALADVSTELRVLSWDGTLRATIPLPDQAGSVAWLDQTRAAVAPMASEHRVEIWDLTTGTRVQTFGRETRVGDRPGAQFGRGIHLEYLPAKRFLYTLDSRTGELEVFDDRGEVVLRHDFGNPRKDEYDAWLAQVNEEQRAKGETMTPVIWQLDFVVDEVGRAQMITNCAPDEQVHLVSVPLAGERVATEWKSDCCPRSFALWDGRFVGFTPTDRPSPACYLERSTP